DVVAFNSLLKAVELGRNWAAALHVARGLLGDGMEPDAVTYGGLASALDRGQQWRLALDVCRAQMRINGVSENVITLTTAINSLAKVGSWVVALSVLRGAEILGIRVDGVACNACVSVAEKGGRWQEALWLDSFMGFNGIRKDVITLNAAISACSKGGRWRHTVALLETKLGVGRATRNCYRAIWTLHCTSEFWRENWRHNAPSLQDYTYDELVSEVHAHKWFRCIPPARVPSFCSQGEFYLQALPTLLSNDFLAGSPGIGWDTTSMSAETFVDLVDSSRDACPMVHLSLRLLLQKVPQVLQNSTMVMAKHRRFHLGAPLWQIPQFPLSSLQQSPPVLAALHLASLAPLAHDLRQQSGRVFIESCVRCGFQTKHLAAGRLRQAQGSRAASGADRPAPSRSSTAGASLWFVGSC
ncbi:unnamed protein product, partial [Polarella glacialis]